MIRRHVRQCSLLLAIALLLGVLLVFAPGFFERSQVEAILVACAPVLVAAVGMTAVIIARQIDISIGSQFCICGIVGALLAKEGLPLGLVFASAILLGAFMGSCNGALIAGLGLPSIVVTLATMVIGRETLRWLREGAFVLDLPPGVQWMGLSQEAGHWAIIAIAVATFVIGALAMRFLHFGRAIFATGSDLEAARLVGIRPRAITFRVFVLMGALTGLAAVLNQVCMAIADPNAGLGFELQVIAAVVVGGTATSGGRGSMVGSLLGVVLLGLIGPALTYLGWRAEWEKAVQGVIILAAVATDSWHRKRG